MSDGVHAVAWKPATPTPTPTPTGAADETFFHGADHGGKDASGTDLSAGGCAG